MSTALLEQSLHAWQRGYKCIKLREKMSHLCEVNPVYC